MKPGTEPISITRGRGGQVEVEGVLDSLSADVLRRAGFLFEPTLRGHWIRFPFDMGRDWENEHATWAAEMLTAARYPVHLDPDLRGHPRASRSFQTGTAAGDDRAGPTRPPAAPLSPTTRRNRSPTPT
ncbi:hypothetical protein ABZ729_07885 [Streptomyces sp. NPDC006678]|uniref:hypothetical protein n=1 Tax=Streptomyces sp. NPDC006678 TaxID=3157185 RepID=UPI003406FE32